MKHPSHRPLHRISEKGLYMVTCATYLKIHHFKTPERLDFLQTSLLQLAEKYNWKLQAWAILANHYHFIAESSSNPKNLSTFLTHLHGVTARYINQLDNTPGRQVWWQYWDSRITYQYSYLARLNYVNKNPSRHGLVKDSSEYRWCSMNWFRESVPPTFMRLVETTKIDRVNVMDDF